MALSDALRGLHIPALPVGSASVDAILERWREALTTCLPDPLRQALARRDDRLILVPHGPKAFLYQGLSDAREGIGELDPNAQEALRAMLAATRRGRTRMIIELPAEQVIKRNVTFPLQVRKSLAQVMRYEIDRLTPFRSDQVCFDYRVRDTAARAEKLEVELAVCRRDLVQGWIERLRSAGAPVQQVTWQGAWPKADLLPAQERPQRGVAALSINKVLVLLVLLLAATSLISTVWQRTWLLEQRSAELRDLKARAEEVYEVRAAIERARQGSLAVLERKSEQPRMIDLLRELTDRLPDDTWVQNLDFRDGEVQIRGESSQATALIGLLEKTPGFKGVAFSSPVVQVATTGQERFHISFNLVRDREP